jgi:hypothetical protein
LECEKDLPFLLLWLPISELCVLQANNFLTVAVAGGAMVMVGALLKEMFWGNGEKKQKT